MDGIPPFLYGTAWKEEQTERLTRLAIEAGFRGIDTANQRKHYFEAAVGAGVAGAIAEGLVTRDELFLQTKFTYRNGQDHRLPYDVEARPAEQVRQSFASSMEHLQTDRLDSYVLHGPSRRRGLAAEDREVWSSMEELQRSGATRFLGISNVSLEQLEALLEVAAVPPSFVQNRCYASTGWDRDVRAVCRRHSIVYQGFSLLTANVRELRSASFLEIVARTGATPAQVVFRFAREVGMLPLTGTTDPAHMREDLAAEELVLSGHEIETIERIGL
ncbi:MAG: aldo/keto reductase [Acidobacteriota bacterium]